MGKKVKGKVKQMQETKEDVVVEEANEEGLVKVCAMHAPRGWPTYHA